MFYYLKVAKKQKYRFSLVLDELRSVDNVEYKTILLEFVNCIIIYTEKIEERIRIRNEFFGKLFYWCPSALQYSPSMLETGTISKALPQKM